MESMPAAVSNREFIFELEQVDHYTGLIKISSARQVEIGTTFLVLAVNEEADTGVSLRGRPHICGFVPDIGPGRNGGTINGWSVTPSDAISEEDPIIIEVKRLNDEPFRFAGVGLKLADDQWASIPHISMRHH